jgi:hypothetical protein
MKAGEITRMPFTNTYSRSAPRTATVSIAAAHSAPIAILFASVRFTR